ncbi:MAG: hypothetical protein KF802_10645 [Bdellovibrionaceae bacterium]|nr:hypothetical protein [Pseudobdellovibrionaceae bacterium]
MRKIFEQAGAAYIAPRLLRGFRWQWVLYGAAAYYGLKLLNKRGVFPDQTGAALNLIDQGVDMVKEKMGMKTPNPGPSGDARANSAPMVH